MRQAIYNLLTGDSLFMAPLSGGLHDAAVVGEISRQNTPTAFDVNGELLPCALLRLSGPVPIPPYNHSARLGFSILFYQRVGTDQAEQARERAYEMLHYRRLSPLGQTVGCWEIHHTDDVTGPEDQALRANLELSRFEAIIRRR